MANSDLEAICRILSLWLRSNGSLERVFTVAAWLREDAVAEMYLDASPWGLGMAAAQPRRNARAALARGRA